MRTLITECLNGASRAERAGLVLLMAIVVIAIAVSIITMLYWYFAEIKRTAHRNALKFAFWLEDAADKFDKWNTLREDAADFTEIADWADYKRWRETQVPMWWQVAGAMMRCGK